MTDPTPLTPESEALLAHASIRARFLNDVTMGKPRPGSIPWLRDELIAIEAAVTARVLADVAARLPEALDGRLIHRLWRDGMLAQRRQVALERLSWDTLTAEDHALDERIADEAAAAILAHLTGGTDR